MREPGVCAQLGDAVIIDAMTSRWRLPCVTGRGPGIGVLAIGLALILVSSLHASTSASPAPRGTIAYEWFDVLRLISANGHRAHRLIPKASIATADTDASWSPDGRRVAFVRKIHGGRSGQTRYAVFSVAANGTDLRQHSNQVPPSPIGASPIRRPEWSADGTRIAYAYWPEGKKFGSSIMVTGLRGGESRVWVDDAHDPAWSPRGELAFSYVRSGRSRIGVVDRFGANRREVAIGTNPRWSPDGSRIGFARDSVAGTGWFTILSARLDGSGERTLARKVAGRGEHRWSPDGEEIAYVGGVTGDPRKAAIFVVDAEGRTRRRLTHDGEYKTVPEWSPDGQWLAFTNWSGDDRIYLVSRDGSQQRRLPANGESPVWRPHRS